MAYIPTEWENEPSTKTPLNAENLNKLEQGVKQIHDMADNGEFDGKDGVTTINKDSAGYGLSVNKDKLELGRLDSGLRVVDLPNDAEGLVIGSVDGIDLQGIVKSKGYLLLKEGKANVGIMSPNSQGYTEMKGVEPMVDGACRAQMMGVRASVIAEELIMMATGSGQLSPAITIPLDNKPRAHMKITDYSSDASESEFFIVNKQYLESEIGKLVSRIEALEAK